MKRESAQDLKIRLLRNPLERADQRAANDSPDDTLASVRAAVSGMRVVIVSNRKDKRLERDLRRVLNVDVVVVDAAGRPRRLRSVADSIQARCCDLVVGTTGFMSHSDEKTLVRAARSAGVPYIRTKNDSVTTIVRSLARDLGLARVANPERWLAQKLSPEKRERLKQLHDLYFPMFTEIETLPGFQISTPTDFYKAPEGYALLMDVDDQRFLFFQDADPAETWTFIEVGRGGAPDQVEHLTDYLAVLEQINERVAKHVRRRNLVGLPPTSSRNADSEPGKMR